jgi:AraC-like DNA-binding protein
MKSRIAGVISGTAIAIGVTVAAFSLVGTANAKSTSAGRSQTQIVVGHGDNGRPDLGTLASVLGLSTSELQTQLQSGKTLADIAKTQSVDVAKVIDTIVADIKTKLAADVAAGELTQAQADAKLTDVTARVTDMVNNGRPAGGMRFRGHGRPDLSALASVLGLSTTELQTQLQSGNSLADIAKAQSVDVAKVIDTIVADMKTRLAADVAAGKITQTQADAKLVDITARVTDMVNNARPEGGMRFGGGGHRGHHGPLGLEQGSDA